MTKEEAIKHLHTYSSTNGSGQTTQEQHGEAKRMAIKALEQPTIEPERKKGEWSIKNGELAIWDVCSECGRMVFHKAPFYNFCPNCGADMRGEENETD